MSFFRAAALAASFVLSLALAARADCPPVYLGASGPIQQAYCGAIIYNGSAAGTLTLPSVSWRGTIINQGPGIVTLVGAGGAPVNGLSAGLLLPPGTGGSVVGDPSAGWAYGGATSAAGSAKAKINALIGGDGTTNLWQRGTAGTAVTTAVTYGSADRWAYWSGAATSMKVIRSSTAADLPAGYLYALKMQRTSGQTGVVQMCMLQEIESVNSYQFQGQVAELDFNAYTGANFSAASANMTAYIIYGTGADEGVAGSASVAFGLNAGGGGSGGWTGQTNATAAVISLGAVSTAGRYAAIANIPATATEVAVALCYTPVGTAGANDYIAFDGIQLVPNAGLAPMASATVGYPCSTLTGGNGGANAIDCSFFERRSQAIETELQQRYYWQINEPAASKIVSSGGSYQTATICDVVIPLPVTMRAIPTVTIGGTAEANTTWAVMSKSTTPVALATTYLIQDAVIGNTTNAVALQATTASTTAGFACELVGAGGGANIQISAEL